MYVFECRAECRTHNSIFKVCFILNAEPNVELTARYSWCMFFRMQSWMSNPQLDIQIVYYFECRAERRSHFSIFKMYVFECRAECRTHSSIFKVCFILNVALNDELRARYSKRMFSHAELDVKPIARYSNCVLFWMQSWMSISQLDIQNVCFRMQSWMSISELDIQDVVFECRAECWTQSSIFKVCFILNAELNVELTARYSKCVCFRMQSWMLNSQLDIQDVCFRMQSWMSNP